MKGVLLLLTILLFVAAPAIAVSSSIASKAPNTAKKVTPLSKALIESFLQATKKIGKLGQKHPELSNYSGGFDAENQAGVVKFLRASAAYPEIETILATSGFSNLEALFSLSERVLAIGYFNKINNSDSVSLFQTEKILQANLNNLRASKASNAIIAKAEKTLNYIKAQVKIVQQKLDTISDEDKAFVQKHSDWLKQKFAAK